MTGRKLLSSSPCCLFLEMLLAVGIAATKRITTSSVAMLSNAPPLISFTTPSPRQLIAIITIPLS